MQHIAKQATIYYANQTGRGSPKDDQDIAVMNGSMLFTQVPERDDFLYGSTYDAEKNSVMFSVYARVNMIEIGLDD